MLDNTDARIIEELQKNSRITMKELGEKVHLTGQAASSRVVKLEESGVIEGYTIKINQAKIDCHIFAFITVFLSNTEHGTFLSFVKNQNDFVFQAYKISGDGCYLLESKFPSYKHLDDFLMQLNKYANYKVSTIISKIE